MREPVYIDQDDNRVPAVTYDETGILFANDKRFTWAQFIALPYEDET